MSLASHCSVFHGAPWFCWLALSYQPKLFLPNNLEKRNSVSLDLTVCNNHYTQIYVSTPNCSILLKMEWNGIFVNHIRISHQLGL